MAFSLYKHSKQRFTSPYPTLALTTNSTEPSSSIEEFQREEALNILASLFTSWATSWNHTSSGLYNLRLSESTKRRVRFYETEQKQAILSLLSSILVAWEGEDRDAFANSIILLAKELRPSLPYVELEPEETLALSPLDMYRLRSFVETMATLLKNTVADLENRSERRFHFNLPPLSLSQAQSLLEEKLNLHQLDFAY